MSFFTYNQNVPNPPNDPSTDVGPMQTNTNSAFSIWNIDHFGFLNDNGGQHQQVSLPAFSAGTLPVAVSGVQESVLYSAAGVADATRAQLYFKNDQATFLISAIKAFAFCTGSTGAITGGQSSNVTVARVSAGNYTVTVSANVLKSVNYLIFISTAQASSTNPTYSYQIVSATSFKLFFNFPNTNVAVDPPTFAFAVIQI